MADKCVEPCYGCYLGQSHRKYDRLRQHSGLQAALPLWRAQAVNGRASGVAGLKEASHLILSRCGLTQSPSCPFQSCPRQRSLRNGGV